MKRWTMYNYPYPKIGLFGKLGNLAKGFSFTSFLDGTQKTLGVINQAIPIVYQVKPIFRNARTVFRIADEINKPTETVASSSSADANKTEVRATTVNSNKPIFYI